MGSDRIDVGKTLRFGTFRRDLIFLAVFAAVAPFAVWFRNWFILALCAGFGLFQLYKVVTARSALTLSPKGIRYAYDGIRFSIPWSEVRAVEMLDFGAYKDVTALTVSRRYYDSHIHTPYGKLLNPSRDDYFEIGDDIVRVALFAGFLGIDRRDLFAMIEARWQAFRAPAPGDALRGSEA